MVKLALEHRKSITEVMRYPSWELPVWRAYHDLDPFGYERLDLNCGMLAYHSTQVHVKKRLDPKDFILKFGPASSRPLTVRQVEAQFKGIAKAQQAAKKQPARR